MVENQAITPFGNRVAVIPSPPKKQTASGLHLPDVNSEQNPPQVGIVMAVGEGYRDSSGKLWPVKLAVGDQVLYRKFGGAEAEILGQKLLVMDATEILAVFGESKYMSESSNFDALTQVG